MGTMIKRNRSELNLWNANLEASSSRRLMALGLALLVAWLLVMALAADVLAGDDPADIAANLVMAVDAGTLAGDASSELAANPELSAVRQYARSTSQSAAMAANPELMAAGRFTGLSGGAASQGGDSSFLAANPEVMTARRYGGTLSECGVALGC